MAWLEIDWVAGPGGLVFRGGSARLPAPAGAEALAEGALRRLSAHLRAQGGAGPGPAGPAVLMLRWRQGWLLAYPRELGLEAARASLRAARGLAPRRLGRRLRFGPGLELEAGGSAGPGGGG